MDPPYNPPAPKNPTPNPERPAGPTPQIPNQPCQANTLDLRYLSSKSNANQFQQILQTCEVGCTVTSCTHVQGHTCTGMRTRTAMVTHARIRMAMAQANSPRPASGFGKSSANPVHSNALNLRHISANSRIRPAYSKALGGMGVNDGVASTSRRQGAAAACMIGPKGPMVVEPEGSTAWHA